MRLVYVILNFTIKRSGPCIGSYRSTETPPELLVLCENTVNDSTSQCLGPTVLWSVLQGKGRSPPWSEKPASPGVNSPAPLLRLLPPIEARTGTQWGFFFVFPFCAKVAEAEIHPLFCNSTLKYAGWRLAEFKPEPCIRNGDVVHTQAENTKSSQIHGIVWVGRNL